MSFDRPLQQVSHKVQLADLATVPVAGAPFADWFAALPRILAGADLHAVVDRWIAARRAGRPAIWGCGAHVIKVGLAPWLIALMEEGLITHLMVNGAVAIHDYELAAAGHTSEEVADALATGVFGQAAETGAFINEAAKCGLAGGQGLGEALTGAFAAANLAHREASLLAAAGRLGVPVAVHLAIGTDTIHGHPAADGRALGETTLVDFRRAASWVAELEGGIYFNVGSAVLLPEIFLKCVAQARAAGRSLSGMTTVAIDFLRQYRALENVVKRPPGKDGRGFYLTGHHEVLVPLLGQAAREAWRKR